jgi:hypothetical protein
VPDLIFATKGQAAVLRAQDDMKRRAQELAAEFKKDAQEADKTRAAILRIYESTKTPQEQLKQRMEVLRKAIRDGTAPPEAITALERLKAKQHETYSAARSEISKSNLSLKELDATQKKTFDTSIVSKWGGAVGGAVSAAIIASFKTIKDEQRKLADDSKAAIAGEGQLAQFANSPAEMRALLAESRMQYASGVGGSRDEAAAVTLAMLNAELGYSDRLSFGRFQSSGLTPNAGNLGRAAATMQANLGGNPIDYVNRAFRIEAAPGSAEQLMIAAAGGAQGAVTLGIGPDELYGATAALSKAKGAESEAGTRIVALLKSLDVAGGYGGKGLANSLADVQSRIAKGEDVRDILGGRQEAVDAFRYLVGHGKGLFALSTAQSSEGFATQAAIRKLGYAESSDPALRAARLAIQTKRAREIATLDEGTMANLVESQNNETLKWIDSLPYGLRQAARLGYQARSEGFNIPLVTQLTGVSVPAYDTMLPNDVLAWSRSQPWVPELEGAGPGWEGSGTPAQREQRGIIQSIVDQKRLAEESKRINEQQREFLGQIARGIGEMLARSTEGGLLIGSE